VVIESYSLQLINIKNQVVVYWKNIRPESSFFAFSWDGSKYPWLLKRYSPSKDIELEKINYSSKTHKLKNIPN
jgi:hypothetical protein